MESTKRSVMKVWNEKGNIKPSEERIHNRTYQVNLRSWLSYPLYAGITSVWLNWSPRVQRRGITLFPSSSGEMPSRAASSLTLLAKSPIPPKDSGAKLRIKNGDGAGSIAIIGTDVLLIARVAWNWGNAKACTDKIWINECLDRGGESVECVRPWLQQRVMVQHRILHP